MGGNGTIISSTAIVVAALSDKTRMPITSALWNQSGLPVIFAICLAVTPLYVLLFPLFSQQALNSGLCCFLTALANARRADLPILIHQAQGRPAAVVISLPGCALKISDPVGS